MEEIIEDKEEILKVKAYKRDLRVCKRALDSVTKVNAFWFFMLTVVGGAEFLYWYVFKQSSNINETTISVAIVGGICIFICLFRMICNFGISKRFSVIERKNHLSKMPSEATATIRELYVSYSCRRCVHYWTTFCLVWLSIISILYFLLIAGVFKSMGKSAKIYESSTWSNLSNLFNQGDWSTILPFFSLGFLLFMWFQYFLFNLQNKKVLRSLENVYGNEKLISECVLASRVFEVNSKYKSTVFFIVCFVGCIFYIFFKRLICSIFDKSFSL